MKKVSFFLSALALVAFAACNNTAEEAVVTDTVDTSKTDEPANNDGDSTKEGDVTPPVEVDPSQDSQDKE